METEDRIMVYDGNCNVCRTAINTLTRWKWIDATKAKDFYELPVEQQSQIELEKFKSEMASIDLNGGRTYYGVEAVCNAMGYRFALLKKLKKESFLFPVIQFFYRMIAWNRYIIMSPVSTVKCDCEPPLNKFYRISLFAFCAIISLIVTALLGIAIGKNALGHWFHYRDMIEFAKASLLMIGSGWALQLLLARVIIRGERFYDYMGHLGIIMLVGALVMLPGIICIVLPDGIFLVLTLICILLSSILMIIMHLHRTKALGLDVGWTVSWLACVYGSLISLGLFYYHQIAVK